MDEDSNISSDGIFGQILGLGTAYFGAQAREGLQGTPAQNQINSTGQVVKTGTDASTHGPAPQIIPGLDNKTLFIGGAAVVGLIVLLAVIKK